jgi:hypothetical protein
MSTHTFELSEEEFHEAREQSEGRCIACGCSADECEPDACEYTCPECGAAKVYGLEELLVMGLVNITSKKKPRVLDRFREEECSGAFDGTSVISDADPGL